MPQSKSLSRQVPIRNFRPRSCRFITRIASVTIYSSPVEAFILLEDCLAGQLLCELWQTLE